MKREGIIGQRGGLGHYLYEGLRDQTDMFGRPWAHVPRDPKRWDLMGDLFSCLVDPEYTTVARTEGEAADLGLDSAPAAVSLRAILRDSTAWDQLRRDPTLRNPLVAGPVCRVLGGQIWDAMPEPEEEDEPEDDEDDDGNEDDGNEDDDGAGFGPVEQVLLEAAVEKALQEAQETLQEVRETGKLPLSQESREATLHDAVEVWTFTQDDRIRAVLRLMGRLTLTIGAEEATIRGLGKVSGLGRGAGLDAPSSSFMALGHPDLKGGWMARYVDRSNPEYRREGTLPCGEGPLVVLLDTSSSMDEDSSTPGLDLLDVSKAVICSLADVATHEGRRVTVLPYTNRTYGDPLEMPQDLLAVLRLRADGGTNFKEPVKRALDIVHQQEGWEGADIVLLTDGEADPVRLTDEMLGGVRIHGIAVDRKPSKCLVETCTTYPVKLDTSNPEMGLAKITKQVRSGVAP